MNEHFLQSKAWQHYQETAGHVTFREKGDGWSYLAISETTLGIKRLYCPYGPTCASEKALAVALQALTQLAKEQKVAFIRLQPNLPNFSPETAKQLALSAIKYSQPVHTWCLDLTQDKDAILSGMKQNTRNIYRNYAKKGLVYEKTTDPAAFSHLLTLLHETAKHNQITIRSDAYLTTQATSLLADHAASIHLMRYESEVIAAALVYEGETTNYYAHAANSFEHRKLGASTALLGEIVFDAKRQGKQTFDFFGIAPTDDPAHRWAGFTAFKKSFGGYEHSFSDTYELSIQRLPHLFYRLAKRFR